MRKPTRTALRWGPPIALTAAAIAALFVVPVFGRATSNLGDRVNATTLIFPAPHLLPHDGQRVGALPLKSGNYVVTSTLTAYRPPQDFVSCQLLLQDDSGLQDADGARSVGPSKNQTAGDQVANTESLSDAAHLGTGGRAVLNCNGGPGKTQLQDIEITAMEVPRLTVKVHGVGH
jgi:hypothetical protein